MRYKQDETIIGDGYKNVGSVLQNNMRYKNRNTDISLYYVNDHYKYVLLLEDFILKDGM